MFFIIIIIILTGRDLPMQVCHWAPSQLAGCWVRTRCSWTTGASPPNVLWSSGNRLRLSDRPPRVILAAIPPTETETFVTHRRANDWNSEKTENVYFNAASNECVCAQNCPLTFGSPARLLSRSANRCSVCFRFSFADSTCGGVLPGRPHTCYTWYFHFHTQVDRLPQVPTWMTTM